MKKLLVTFILIILSFITYSQSGVGYLNYTIYNTNNSTYRNTYPTNDAGFVNLFNTATGTTIFKSGTTTALNALYYNQTFFTGVPNGGGYFGIQTTGWFVPKETGTYTFGIDGDDAVDFLLDGVVVTSFYGVHGFGGYRYGTIDLVAGRTYTLKARFQQVGGGWGMYLVWKRPSQSTYNVQSDEVTSLAPAIPTKKATANFNFNTSLTPTTFSIGSNALSSIGSIDITTSLDSVKIANGNNVNITSGQVEWSYVNILNGVTTLYIDDRQFGSVAKNSVKTVSILDAYTGPITFLTDDGTWAQYSIPSTLSKITNGTSTYNSNIRNAGYSNYAFTCNIAFATNMVYKPQSIILTTTNNLSQIYTNIVTISDVYMAFKELANTGILGNQNGNEFTYGIQYKNADINNDGIFDELDCFKLLQHLTGKKNIVDTFTLPNTLRLISTDTYNKIGKSNWSTFTTPLSDVYSFDINTGKPTDTFNISTSWKGDVNLSHSTTPASNGITTMALKSMNLTTNSMDNIINASIMGENIGGNLVVTLSIDPLQQELVGTQFLLNYDTTALKFDKVEFTTKGTPTNYATNRGSAINFGSLLTDGSTLDKTTQYKITFLPLMMLSDILGLTSFSTTDAVNKNGTQLKVKLN
jgi:hypothetical protein